MKYLFTLFFLSTFGYLNGQSEPTAISMSAAEGKYVDGTYRYFAKGADKPYTGVLYAKYPNGNYQSYQDFQDGIGQGTWINYYENGNYKEIGTYQQNKVKGPIKKYHPNGKLAAEGNYREWRIRVGEWKYYDQKGNLIKTENYGKIGDFRDVEGYYQRGEISKRWYEQIISSTIE